MSLEKDIQGIKEADIFQPAEEKEVLARRKQSGELWVSLRIVRAKTYAEAVRKVENGEDFEEDHSLCDSIIPARRILISGQRIEEEY